jgi:hypothetical protein
MEGSTMGGAHGKDLHVPSPFPPSLPSSLPPSLPPSQTVTGKKPQVSGERPEVGPLRLPGRVEVKGVPCLVAGLRDGGRYLVQVLNVVRRVGGRGRGRGREGSAGPFPPPVPLEGLGGAGGWRPAVLAGRRPGLGRLPLAWDGVIPTTPSLLIAAFSFLGGPAAVGAGLLLSPATRPIATTSFVPGPGFHPDNDSMGPLQEPRYPQMQGGEREGGRAGGRGRERAGAFPTIRGGQDADGIQVPTHFFEPSSSSLNDESLLVPDFVQEILGRQRINEAGQASVNLGGGRAKLVPMRTTRRDVVEKKINMTHQSIFLLAVLCWPRKVSFWGACERAEVG